MKKGFTLIEILGVIVILGIIIIIVIPIINNAIINSKEKAFNEQISIIENSAKTYMANNSLELPSQQEGDFTCLSIRTLKKEGFLSNKDILNPKYKQNSTIYNESFEKFDGEVKVEWKGTKYIYKYVDMCS